ncbi:MAG: twin-arginine translocation signal domain-containing protein [Gemmataceae bacterium]
MDRRHFLARCSAVAGGAALFLTGCRSQHAHVISDCKQDMVGSCAAGAETYKPLVNEAVGKLLMRHGDPVQLTSTNPPGPKRICFVGIENRSAEEMGDFKDQITEVIDTKIVESKVFQPISRRFVEVGLRTVRLRPDELFLPMNQRQFLAVMEQQGQPFDYLLFASLTSGTTRNNSDMQRDYLLTLELVDIKTGAPDKESATLRKGYHKSLLNKAMAY